MDLTTTYLGLNLRNPLVVSSSPLSRTVEGIRRLEDAGAGAVVMPSLFEEQIDHESEFVQDAISHGSESALEALRYLPENDRYLIGPDEYLKTIRSAKESTGIPLIASLNGISAGGWMKYAHLIEQAGADALEINLYQLCTDADLTSHDVEQSYINVIQAVRKKTKLPIAVKLSPFFTSLPNFVQELVHERVNGLVLFNRFYQPDIDLDKMEIVSGLTLSQSDDLRLPLRWTAILYGRVPVDLAITSGIHNHIDVLKAISAGATVTMMASELLEHGTLRISGILGETCRWMDEHGVESLNPFRGSMSQEKVHDPAAFERANYMKVIHSIGYVPS